MGFVLRVVVFEVLIAVLLFGCAGRIDLPWFWAVIAVHTVLMTLGGVVIDEGLRHERVRPGPGGTDRAFRFFAMPLLFAHLIIAGLDVGRHGWSGTVSTAVHAGSLVLYAAGLAWIIRAMQVNRFFSPVVRIQNERGHHVVKTGPYAVVRHPGYLGVMVTTICSGPALGSWWSLMPIAALLPLFLRRLVIEDRYLHQHLAGYREYAEIVRYRLLPRIW